MGKIFPVVPLELTSAAPAARAEIFGSVFLLAQYLARRGDDALLPLGLTTRQWLLLAVIQKKFPGQSPTLSEAAHWYGSSRQNVKQLAGQLEARGYLHLSRDPADRRALRLQVTDKVKEFDSPRGAARLSALMEDLLGAFDDSELPRLRELLRRWLIVVSPR
jgi:DNA-binding MarR family transcriptional regulator